MDAPVLVPDPDQTEHAGTRDTLAALAELFAPAQDSTAIRDRATRHAATAFGSVALFLGDIAAADSAPLASSVADETLCGAWRERGAPDTAADDPARKRTAQGARWHSLDTTVAGHGLLRLTRPAPAFSPADRDRAQQFARLLAAALDHAAGAAQAARQQRAFALLAATERLFARRLDDADLLLTALTELVGQIGRFLDAGCALFLAGRDQVPPRLIDLYRADPVERERQRAALHAAPPRLDEGVFAEIARSGVGKRDLRLADGPAPLTKANETALAVSLHHDGQSYGLLLVWGDAADPPSEAEFHLCEALGRRAATALAEHELAQFALATRDLLADSPDPTFRLSIGGRILEANTALCRLLGFSAAELIERHIGDLLAPEERDTIIETLAGITISGIPLDPHEWALVRANGERRVIEVRARILSDLGQPAEIYCAGRDLTARREDQRALARQGTELATLHIAGLALADAIEPGEIRQALLGAIRAALPCDDVTIYTIERGAMRPELALQADSGPPPDFPHGHPLIDESVAHGQSVLLNDAPSDPEFVGIDSARSLHFLITPLLASGQVGGCVVLRRMTGEPFTLNDLRLVESIATPAALTLQNARLHAETSGAATDLRMVLESIQQGVLLTDRAGRVRFANRRFGELFGIDLRTLIGWHERDVAERLLAPRARDPKGLLARLAWLDEHPEERSTDEVALSRATGQILERYTGPMRDPGNRALVGRIVVFTDVTASRQLERAKDEFLATASHELKTPITTLGGYLELLERQVARPTGADPDRLAHYVGAARSELARLRLLSEELLEVARIEAGRLTLKLETTDLAQTVRETVGRFVRRPGLADRGHRLICVADEPLPTTHDALRIGQVVSNLIENALKYSPDGGDVVVAARREGALAAVSVRDSGIGVPEGEREALFLPFYRTANASAGSPEGLGLGLYISRGIVEGHGGRIWAESAGERGTIFTMTLPLA